MGQKLRIETKERPSEWVEWKERGGNENMIHKSFVKNQTNKWYYSKALSIHIQLSGLAPKPRMSLLEQVLQCCFNRYQTYSV